MGNILDCSTGEELRSDEIISPPTITKTDSSYFILQGKQRVPDSIIWTRQREYFETIANDKSILKSSSFSSTSNCYAARCYATVILSYILDWYSDPSHDTSDPIYIIDVGAGFGKLSLFIMYSLYERKDQWPECDHAPFVYVLTDISESYLQFWKNDPLLAQFMQMGYMDYSLFDIQKDTSLTLEISRLCITANSLHSSPFFMCSSVFSVLPQDILVIEEGNVKTAVISVLQQEGVSPGPDMSKLRFSWEYETLPDPTSLPYWGHISDTVRTLIQSGQKSVLMVPMVVLDFMQVGNGWSRVGSAFLAADRGVFSLDETHVVQDPFVHVGHCAELSVNFAVIDSFVRSHGGFMCCSSFHEENRCVLCVMNRGKEELSRTCWSYRSQIAEFTPQSFYELQTSLQKGIQYSATCAQSLIRLGQFDSELFNSYKDVLLRAYAKEQTINTNTIKDLMVDLDHIYEHTHYMNPSSDICFDLGRIYMGIGRYDVAYNLFKDSNEFMSEHHITWFNMGICACYTKQSKIGIICFKRCLEMRPDFTAAVKWLQIATAAVAQSAKRAASEATAEQQNEVNEQTQEVEEQTQEMEETQES